MACGELEAVHAKLSELLTSGELRCAVTERVAGAYQEYDQDRLDGLTVTVSASEQRIVRYTREQGDFPMPLSPRGAIGNS